VVAYITILFGTNVMIYVKDVYVSIDNNNWYYFTLNIIGGYRGIPGISRNTQLFYAPSIYRYIYTYVYLIY